MVQSFASSPAAQPYINGEVSAGDLAAPGGGDKGRFSDKRCDAGLVGEKLSNSLSGQFAASIGAGA
jgi:hypothetical protein